MLLTWIACLANFPSAPIKIATFLTNPITRLVFNRTFVAGIEDRRVLQMPRIQKTFDDQSGRTYWRPKKVVRTYLTLLRKRLVVWPKHKT